MRTVEMSRRQATSEEELRLWRALGQRAGIAATLDRLGEIALRGGQLDSASHLFEEALSESAETGDATITAHIHGNIAVLGGEVARQLGDMAEAIRAYEEALAIFESAPQAVWHLFPDYLTFVRDRLAQCEGSCHQPQRR
jgi:tetratricopeptide (TPR) repeat protein